MGREGVDGDWNVHTPHGDQGQQREGDGDDKADVNPAADAVHRDREAAERGRDGDRDPSQDRLHGEARARAALSASASPTTANSVGLAMLDHAMTKTSPAKTNGHEGAAQ